jgi:hypothetical protein
MLSLPQWIKMPTEKSPNPRRKVEWPKILTRMTPMRMGSSPKKNFWREWRNVVQRAVAALQGAVVVQAAVLLRAVALELPQRMEVVGWGGVFAQPCFAA